MGTMELCGSIHTIEEHGNDFCPQTACTYTVGTRREHPFRFPVFPETDTLLDIHFNAELVYGVYSGVANKNG